MSQTQPEPERYSIDEMMERIKGKPSSDPADGELVTRPDGTQAIRVRKRKRRTEQPVKQAAQQLRRVRIIQVSAALILLAILGVSIGVAFIYANSPPYRNSVAAAIAHHAGAEVKFTGFRVTPVSANADAVTLAWPDGSPLRSAKLIGLTAKVSPLSLLGRKVTGDEAIAREATLELQLPKHGNPTRANTDGAGLPEFKFNRILSPKVNATFGNPAKPALKILSSEASLHLGSDKQAASLHLYRGDLQIHGRSPLKIGRGDMVFHGQEIEVSNLSLLDTTPQTPGTLSLVGSLHPFSSTKASVLALKLENFKLDDIIGPELGRIVTTPRIDSQQAADTNYLSFPAGLSGTPDFEISFKNGIGAPVTFKGFPFLQRLYTIMDDKFYNEPVFDGDATGIICGKDDTLEIRNLKLENRISLALDVTITVSPLKSLSGSIRVGIPKSALDVYQDPKLNVLLGPLTDGYRWVTLKVSGTLSHPNDDFDQLYSAIVAPKEVPTADDADSGK